MDKNMYSSLDWPYPVEYGQEIRDKADVLVIGGGLAGCFTAIHAAKRGASVIVMEKGATIRSGAAGAGIDHWSFCFSNPCSKITPEEMVQILGMDPFMALHNAYICFRESYEALLDLEEWGVKVRDTDNIFEGAPFRDEKTKLLFAYDYVNKFAIRIFGAKLKPAIYKEMKRLGIKIYDRTMATMLLTKDGKQGSEVIGATGVNTRTGKFCAFSAKATVLATAKPLRLWEWGSEAVGSNSAHDDPNCAGDGNVMAFKAGAKLIMMESSGLTAGALRYPPYGTGNCSNSWFPCNMVDAEGKTIPWTDRDGNIVEDVTARSLPVEGQRFILGGGMPAPYPFAAPHIIKDLEERIMKGEYKQPFFADLPSMPEHERYAIFGLHIGNEGKTRVPVYKALVDAGFDPDKDMLMANVTHPKIAGKAMPVWMGFAEGVTDPCKRDTGFFLSGGLVVDWKHQTTLESLFAVGNQVAGAEGASNAAANGRYCGRNVAKYVRDREFIQPSEDQIQKEKERVYAPLSNKEGYGWKEIQIGLCRAMQDYLGEYKEEKILKMGLWWMDSIRKTEIAKAYVNNPHELIRLLECEVRLSVGEIIMHSSLARKSSSKSLDFKRIDYPEQPPVNEDSFIAIYNDNGQVKYEKLPFYFWLANGKSYEENYLENCEREDV
jgi:succinate dehydrogenase/fumarate reductase flavoprotein subunit